MPDLVRQIRIGEVQFECRTLVDACVYVCRNRRDSRKVRIHASTTDTGLGGYRSVKKGMYVAYLSSSFVHELYPKIGCHMNWG